MPTVQRSGSSKLQDVTLADIQEPLRIEALYRRAVRDGVAHDSVTRQLDFFSAAVHATAKGRHPVKLFCYLVNGGYWHLISNDSEDVAREMLRALRPTRPRQCNGGEPRAASEIVSSLLRRLTRKETQ